MLRRNSLWRRGVCILFAIGMIGSPAFAQTAFVQAASAEETPQMIKIAEVTGDSLGLTEADKVDSNLFTYQSPLVGTAPGVYKAVEEQPAVVVGSNLVRVRSGAGTNYDEVTQLVRYQSITILGEETAANNIIWYRIRFTRNGNDEVGYMHSTYVMKTTPIEEVESSEKAFEEAIADFPDSYKPTLRGLHKMFPGWIFEPVLTGISWEDVVAGEYVLKRNLVPNSKTNLSAASAFSWKSVRDGDYDWDSNAWISHDGEWVGASKEAIAYYLDPRNFLTADCRITQFETLSYEEGVQNQSGLEAILSGSFMGNDTYYDYFLNAAKEANVSPYLLASRCLQEVSREGSSTTKGDYPGYEGYYNFFNIGASAGTDGSGAVENALKYAKDKGWDSPEKSIIGGAKFLGANYIAIGQNTFYFQKFDVLNKDKEKLYTHQYMQNLSAASTEGASYQKIYGKNWENAEIVYRIPVYEDMPEEAAPLPVGLTNDYKTLSTLTINGKEIESFDGEQISYEIILPAGLAEFRADCPMKTAGVEVPGAVCFTTGSFEKEVVVTAEDGSSQSYQLHITVEEGLKGDADGDSEITAADALVILKTVAKLYMQEGEGFSPLNVDGDDLVTAADALHILKYVAKMIDEL